MKEPKKEMSDEEITEFWKNYKDPHPELGEIFVSALKAGVRKQQREDEDAKKQKIQPPQP